MAMKKSQQLAFVLLAIGVVVALLVHWVWPINWIVFVIIVAVISGISYEGLLKISAREAIVDRLK